MPNKIEVISFLEQKLPVFTETVGEQKRVRYGADDKYPDYLLEKYNKSPKHNAIINAKAKYIAGKGFEGGEAEVNQYKETVNKLLNKQTLDLEIHGGFYVQVIWDKGGQKAQAFHMDYHKVRSNEDNTEFYYNPDGWHSGKKDKIKTYPAFDPEKRKGTQVLYFKEYRPGINTYTLPNYIGALNFIEADICVSEHVWNNAKHGFTPSKMITLTDGEPTEEEKKAIKKAIKAEMTGANGTKFVLNFVNGEDKKPIIEDLGQSDLSKENFEHVDKLIQDNIFIGHSVTNPMLMGVMVAGQLGGRNELMEAWELMKNTYVNAKQQHLEEVWSVLAPLVGVTIKKIMPTDPIGYDLLGNSNLFNLLPKKFIYEKIGINPDDYPELEAEQQAKEEAKAKKGLFSAQDDESALQFFAELGAPKKDYTVLKTKRTLFTSNEECEFSEQLAFAEINQAEANVLDMVRKDKRITPEALASALKLPVAYVERLLSGLEEKGLLTAKTERVGEDTQVVRTPTEETPKVLEEKRPLTKEVFIKYSYEGPQDEKNRDFCHRLLELDKVYSRAEIEQISQRLGYSVWERRGGFYHNPTTGETTPYCRHRWMQNIVIKNK